MELWYPLAMLIPANKPGLSFAAGALYRGVLHTTEGKTAEGSFSVYKAKGYWPHFTASFETGDFQIWQHLPLDVGGYALANIGGGVETNRQRAIQIELVGSADINNKSWGDAYVENFPDAYLSGIAKWMRWLEVQTGVKRIAVPRWLPYPKSYGADNGIRMTPAAWTFFNGWCGHQHVPENLHGDPGLINISRLLENDMPDANDVIDEVRSDFRELHHGDRDTKDLNDYSNKLILSKLEALQADIDLIKSQLPTS